MIDRRGFIKLLLGAGVATAASGRSSAHGGRAANESFNVKLVGVGGGASGIVQSLWNDGIRYADLVCVDTDRESLDMLPGVRKLFIGSGDSACLAPDRGEAVRRARRPPKFPSRFLRPVFVVAGK